MFQMNTSDPVENFPLYASSRSEEEHPPQQAKFES
ncbi:hypothetical protein C6341_g5815 [Phytophthora cactorum]|nr:hypothetical protein C6341_g5815 [Phytophthora cactorum]